MNNDWPEYESHKIVRAMKIVDYKYDGAGTMIAAVTEDGADFVPALPEMMNRSVPGDWAMLYPSGYKSVSPAKAFEEGYAPLRIHKSEFLTIGWAVKQLHNGSRVRRVGWNGKGMWLALITGAQWDMPRDLDLKLSIQNQEAKGGYAYRGPFVAMRAADGMLVPWLCSQSDLLAADWEIAD